MEFEQEGGEGPTPYEVLLYAAMQGDSTPFTRQDAVEETWRILRPLDRAAAAGARLCAGQLGAARGRRSAQRLRPLARPLGGVMSRGRADASRAQQSQARDAEKAKPAPAEGRARQRRRRLRRSPTTRSCRIATPVRCWRRTARSTGCACPASTRRRAFGSLLDREAGMFRVAPFGVMRAGRSPLRARHQRAGHDLEDVGGVDRGPRCADDGADPA